MLGFLELWRALDKRVGWEKKFTKFFSTNHVLSRFSQQVYWYSTVVFRTIRFAIYPLFSICNWYSGVKIFNIVSIYSQHFEISMRRGRGRTLLSWPYSPSLGLINMKKVINFLTFSIALYVKKRYKTNKN